MAVPMLGAVVPYGRIVAPLQHGWLQAAAARPDHLRTFLGTRVTSLTNVAGGVDAHADRTERFDLAVVAEGGLFADQTRRPVSRDYGQAAWVGTVTLDAARRHGVAFEHFTRQGPLALLPLQGDRAAIVWCVTGEDDPVAPLDDAQRVAVLNAYLPAEAGRVLAVSSMKRFELGLNAERSLTDGRIVRIGNAAQTLHPVAGQGLNLGLRDAWVLVDALANAPGIDAALRRLEWRRGPDRWATMAVTDFLARSFTWQVPGADIARGLALGVLQALGPLKSALARHMMFGTR